ncbi:MAG: tetraacyldisaccharide 4'-kinase [Pseudomonadota bacterium]|nr:tetraacyldisaccharide 4'-kinase [Pseudomonadota bacterium]
MNNFFVKIWYGPLNILSVILFPLSVIFFLTITLRKFFYKIGIFKVFKFKTPILIVGNLTVGGTGKTPLVIWLNNYFTERGIKVGIITSGYRSNIKNSSIIRSDLEAPKYGDEASLIYSETRTNVISGKDRVLSTLMMEKEFKCDLIIHDDGLQNYSIHRDLEILLIDSEKKFGNGLLLPAGPLRETKNRLDCTDIIAINNSSDSTVPAIELNNSKIKNSLTSKTHNIKEFSGKRVHLVTGIGNPSRLENILKKHKILYCSHLYKDHHKYNGDEIIFKDDLPIFITTKDYIKLKLLKTPSPFIKNNNLWIMQLDISPNIKFTSYLDNWINLEFGNEN